MTYCGYINNNYLFAGANPYGTFASPYSFQFNPYINSCFSYLMAGTYYGSNLGVYMNPNMFPYGNIGSNLWQNSSMNFGFNYSNPFKFNTNFSNPFAQKFNLYTNTQKTNNPTTNQNVKNESTNGKTASNNDKMNVPYSGSADDINKALKGKLDGKGGVFIQAQNKYGVNAAMLASICMLESGNGKSNLAQNKNNVGGVRIAGSHTFRTFDKVDDCIMYMASFLKKSYVDKGLLTLPQIGAKYCPTNDPTDKKGTNGGWAGSVNSLYKKNFA